jgi:hypothetical protein
MGLSLSFYFYRCFILRRSVPELREKRYDAILRMCLQWCMCAFYGVSIDLVCAISLHR